MTTTNVDATLRQGLSLTDTFAALERKITTTRAVVGVVGQGYVGFPLAQRIAQVGYTTFGFDISGATVERCKTANRFPTYQAVRSAIHLADCDVILIAVPTPTKDHEDGRREPDLTLVVNAVKTVLVNMADDGQARLLLLESTYAPGTTRNVVGPLVAAKHTIGETIALGYSPERIDPGNATFHLVNTPKVTSGYDEACAHLAHTFYSQIVERAVPASSMEAAEATKILENTFRFVNITFAQEFDEYCEREGLSAREITTLAATKGFGFMPFTAGAGIGGHCIAEDPYYLYQAILDSGHASPILAAAIANHEERAGVIIERVVRRLGGRPIHDARILFLGVSYKPNIGDARRSPAQPLLELLEHEGAHVDYHDQHVARFCGRTSVDLDDVRPTDYHLAVLVTDHSGIDYRGMVQAGWRILDTKGALDTHKAPSREPATAAGVERRPATKLGEVLRLFKTRPAEVNG
jgi:UDP-N-acetyl-D-glucosamine dehydrogenase